MKLYLMRHGDYNMEDILHGNPLSEKGHNEVSKMADFLSHTAIRVSHVFHSEKLRAKQTAYLLVNGILCNETPQEIPGINPTDDVSLFAAEVNHWENDAAVVGHLPFLGRLSSLLLTQSEANDIVSFQPGTLACLEKVGTTRWTINWVLSPSLFSDSLS